MKAVALLIPVFFLLNNELVSTTSTTKIVKKLSSEADTENSIFSLVHDYDNSNYGSYDNEQDNNKFFTEYESQNGRASKHIRSRVERDTTAESQEEADYDEAKAKQKLDDEKRKKLTLKNEMSTKKKTKDSSDDLQFPENYNVFEIPKDPSGSPLPVFIHVNVKTILDVDELNEYIKLDLEFKVMWTDFKIFYHNNQSIDPNTFQYNIPFIDKLTPEEVKQKRKVLNNPSILDKIWKPNLFIENLLAVRQPAVMARPLTIKFIPEVGWFEYITRISVKLDCEMKFHYYPADTQFCDFSIRGFSYNKERLNLNWYQNGAYLDDLELPSFDVQIESVSEYEWTKNNEPDEVFEVLNFRVAARRRLSYHLVQTYLASTFYIIITCLCFLLPSKMVEARIGISMTTLLTLTAMFASVRESTPIVSYVKAIDIWMVGCIFFVFLTLSQFTFHIWLRNVKEEFMEKQSRRNELKKSHKNFGRSIESFEMGSVSDYTDKTINIHPSVDDKMDKKFQIYDMMANFIDKYSFILFICIFAFGSVLYWTWLLQKADYFNWSVNETLNNVEDD